SEVQEKKEKIRKEFNLELKEKIEGQKKLTAVFDECINCHNCMRVCPICYCQQCFFDSDSLTLSPETYISRAEKKGALRFPLDTMLFHLGRMSHMVLSCVSCGVCEDACPMSIPVAQIFSLVADQTQKSFDYAPGINKEEPLPLQDFLEDEFHEVETPSEAMTPEEVN
ncbi:MAG: coenzyme F420 hydrogenase, partial [Candidatus Aminicenantes bacterium]|nr:coenzyme F420 hydrogenase [Candidatus Aminicenantes bacterium]